MSDTDRLVDFISAAKGKQVADDFIASLLRQQGWSDQRVYQAFAAYYESALGQPVPSRGSRIEGAREAFLYLLSFITLGCWIVAFILLADQLITHLLPSPLDPSSAFSRQESAGQLATLIVAFPLFLFVNRLIVKEVERRPEALESGVRKWLTYIALVLTAVTLIGDAVAVIYSLLTGDLTSRFLLEAAVLFVVAGGVFWYYLGAVSAAGSNDARNRVFGWTAVAAVLLVVVSGFTLTGTPAHQRELTVDDRRLTQLSRIAETLHMQTAADPKKTKPLPQSLTGVPSFTAEDYRDPETHVPYEYDRISDTTYRLCAVFAAASDEKRVPTAWAHKAGHQCFELDATTQPVQFYGAYY